MDPMRTTPRIEEAKLTRPAVLTLPAVLTVLAGLAVIAGSSPAAAQGNDPTGPMTLEQSVALALEQNRDIREARLQLGVADQQVVEARGNALPSIDATASYTRNLTALKSFLPAIFIDPNAEPDEFIAVQFGADNSWNANVTLSQPLFDYQVFVGLKVAGRARQLQVEALRGTAQQAATRTRKAFYGVLLASEQVRLTENSVQRVRQVLEESRARNRAGLASDYDVLRLEVQLGNLQPQLRQARDGLEAARRQLTLQMALPVDTPVEAAGSLMAIDLETEGAGDPASRQLLEVAGLPDARQMGYVEVLSAALEDRADIRQTEIDLELDDARVMRAMSEFFPSLNASYTYTLSAQENDDPDFFGENSRQRAGNQSAGLQLQIPIFSGFQRFARVRQEELGREQSRTRLDALHEQAADQVKTLLAGLEETRQRALAQARSVGQAQRGFEIASTQYSEGVGSRLEVVDAENALRQAQFNYAQAVFDHLNAQADLDLAAGRVPLVDEVMQVEVEDR